MYLIYVDEAGTSANEPVSVIVGIVVHDTQWRDVYAALAEVRARIPNHLLDPDRINSGFISHATTIWNDPKLREGWPRAQRLEFIKALVAIPRLLKLPIALGKVRRDSEPVAEFYGGKLSEPQAQHLIAFSTCIAKADKFVRVEGRGREISTVVCEDVPDIRKWLQAGVDVFRYAPLRTPISGLRPTKREQMAGRVIQDGNIEISTLVDTVHFVAKNDGPLLQISDACAFSFRRYFAGQDQGGELVEAMLDECLVPEDWAGPLSAGLWHWRQPNLRPGGSNGPSGIFRAGPFSI